MQFKCHFLLYAVDFVILSISKDIDCSFFGLQMDFGVVTCSQMEVVAIILVMWSFYAIFCMTHFSLAFTFKAKQSEI